jgi:hypothetical protein
VLLLSVPLILLQWGYSWPDIYDSYSQLFFGFRIGNTEVSFAVLFAPGFSVPSSTLRPMWRMLACLRVAKIPTV